MYPCYTLEYICSSKTKWTPDRMLRVLLLVLILFTSSNHYGDRARSFSTIGTARGFTIFTPTRQTLVHFLDHNPYSQSFVESSMKMKINAIRNENILYSTPKQLEEESDIFFIREADFADLGAAARILTDGFFADKTNFITYQFERIKTLLSLESTYPQRNINSNIINNYYNISGDKKDEQILQQHFMLISGLQSNGKVIGFAELDKRPPKPSSSSAYATETTVPPPPRPYMCNLAVDISWKRQGVASALINCCEDICTHYWGCEYMYLKVRRGNEAAIQLYKGLGYEEMSKNFFSEIKTMSFSTPTTVIENGVTQSLTQSNRQHPPTIDDNDEIILMGKTLSLPSVINVKKNIK